MKDDDYEKEKQLWWSYTNGFEDIDKMSEDDQYKMADNMLDLALLQVSVMLPKTHIWHSGCTRLNTWTAGKTKAMDRQLHFDDKMSKKDCHDLVDIMLREK